MQYKNSVLMGKVMPNRIDEYIVRPTNPNDGDTYRDSENIQWVYIGEVKEWSIDLRDPETNSRYHSVDHLPNGTPDSKGGITGKDAVFGWLDENT